MALKKLCPRCNKIIDIDQQYCEEHQKQVDQSLKNRHREYKANRSDKNEQKFYKSKEWLKLREYLKVKYKGLCLYSYLVDNIIVPAAEYHHIEPIKDNWSKRLDVYNIIPLSYMVHRNITEIYKTNKKEETQIMLRGLLIRWREINEIR
ncbi:hypothetical protein [Rhodopseudomonas parapalustris]